jgi:hypothetical protein
MFTDVGLGNCQISVIGACSVREIGQVEALRTWSTSFSSGRPVESIRVADVFLSAMVPYVHDWGKTCPEALVTDNLDNVDNLTHGSLQLIAFPVHKRAAVCT